MAKKVFPKVWNKEVERVKQLVSELAAQRTRGDSRHKYYLYNEVLAKAERNYRDSTVFDELKKCI